MKHEKLSLKWKIFGYLLGLSSVILAALWICQTVYLDKFYKYIKEQDMEESVALLQGALQKEEPSEDIKAIAQSKELSLKIVDSRGEELYSEQYDPVSAIQSLTKEQFQMYYKEVEKHGGQLEFSSNEELRKEKERQKDGEMINPDEKKVFQKDFMDYGHVQGRNYGHNSFVIVTDMGVDIERIVPPIGIDRPIERYLVNGIRGGQESMVCAKIMEMQGEECLALISIKLTPVDATVQTLRVQLVYISVIIIILSLLLAFLISRSVSKSIIKVNYSAKELAKGNFDVTFEGRDYREIEQLSDTLNYAATELAKTESLQRELLANVSHDLRTPLTMIIAYSEVMRDLPGENTPENVQVVIEEAQRLTNLVNDMLDISKLQSGVMKLEKRTYDLTDSINGVMERYVKLKEQEQYQIQFVYDRHVEVCADEYKIFQVLYNLINNAINYTGKDKQVVVEQLVKKDVVRIQVRDTGEGIPKEELENVWERYYKVDKVHKRAIQGTGLGLSICKNILKLHKAEYGVESEVGRGSTFWFELKLL